ncbi:MAG: hypothetical protein BGP01_00775 [Paludibacter sp. 47-17]|nr:MAG: hypothetical protein BGP01_00775 [Paludibacter sp. 47-17]
MRPIVTVVIAGMMLIVQSAFAQSSAEDVIVGTVTAKSEGPLIGVNVKEIDATNRIISGASTDINGTFVIRVKNRNNKLEFSYIGYQTLRIDPGKQQRLNVVLKEIDNQIKEIEITARKRTNTGTLTIPDREISSAIQTVKADFEGLSVASLDEALQGQIAGLDIIANSGDVGAGSAMRLRGTASINADVTPLIVVNDLIFDSGTTDNFDFVNANPENFANLLSINVDDIESISVMKDGAATAQWGTRGANGVISIRTKKGVRGKPKLQYTYRMSRKWQPEGMKMLNGDEYTMFLKEAYFNPKHSEQASDIQELNYIRNDAVFPDWRMYNNNTDWVKAVTTIGMTDDHYLTLSGGGEKATFYLSGGYYNEKGSIIQQNLDRYTTRMDLNYYVSDRILFQSEMSFTYTNEHKNYEGLLGAAYRKMPNLAIYKEDEMENPTGEFYTISQTMSSALNDQKGIRNPVAVAYLATNNVKSYRLNPTFRLQYDLLPVEENKMLRLKGLVSFGISNNSSYSYLPKELSSGVWTESSVNTVSFGNNSSRSVTSRIELQWIPTFADKSHSLSLYGAGEMNGGSSESQFEASYGIPNGITSPTTGSYVSGMGSSNNYWRGMAFVAVSHYSYKSKYSAGLTIRRDGSSKFGPKRKFGTFGGASFRWNIIDEEFMKSTHDWLSMLSLRVGTGLTGNSPRDEYLHYSRYESWSSYLEGGTVRPVSVRLNDLRWETVHDTNFGGDIGFLDDRFDASFNIYNKITSDLLNRDVSIPTSSGYPVYSWQNVGKVQNVGWELYLNARKLIKSGNKLSVDFNLNFANNRNTVLELSDIVLNRYNQDYDFNNGSYMSRLQLGNSLGSIYGFRYKGVYQYSIDNPRLVESGYTLGTAPVARNEANEIIFDSEGKPVPVYFAYGTSNQLAFQGGDAIYEDINNDGNINELDIVYLGNSNPKINGGGGFKINYGRMSLNLYSVFRIGNKVVNAARMNAENMYSNNNQTTTIKWRWRKEGDQTHIPRALYGSGRNFLGSDRYVEDASFWRINQITLNYSLPQELLNKLSLSSVNTFFTLYNAFFLTNYSGVDPEVGYGSWGVSTDNNQTPRSRSFTAGFSVRF